MSLNVGIWGTSKHSVEKILTKIMMNKKLKDRIDFGRVTKIIKHFYSSNVIEENKFLRVISLLFLKK